MELVNHLVSDRHCEKVVLIGHSTGCQNCVHFMTHVAEDIKRRVIGVILQAPVSDQECGEMDGSELTRHLIWARTQTNPKSTLMPMEAHYTPITVARFLSLVSKVCVCVFIIFL